MCDLILAYSDCLRSEFQASGFAGREVAKVPISLRGRRVLIQTRTVHEPHRRSTSVNVKTHIYFNVSYAFSCCFRTWFWLVLITLLGHPGTSLCRRFSSNVYLPFAWVWLWSRWVKSFVFQRLPGEDRTWQRQNRVEQSDTRWYMAMDQYLYIPFLGGWTSIYQLFWCSPGE